MTIWDQFSSNPDANTKPPPLGAGFEQLAWSSVSRTFRAVMAAIAEVGTMIKAHTDAAGSMSGQNANNVAITGGTLVGVTLSTSSLTTVSISDAASIAAAAINSGFLALARLPTNLTGKLADGLTSGATQILYDLIYPVGTHRLWWSASLTQLVWPGVTATWVDLSAAAGAVLAVAGEHTGLLGGLGSHIIGDGSEPGLPTTSAGGHTPTIQGHVLTTAEIPILASVTADTGGSDATKKVVTSQTAAAHTHTADAVAAHAHTVALDIWRYGFKVVHRTA